MCWCAGHLTHVMTYLREYLFRATSRRASRCAPLSGGERNRLLLAKALAAPSNMIVLDEPTNDLDADTLDLLQEALDDYDGTVLLVSHDRDFLDRLVTSTIVLEGDGTAVEYAGGYSDYVDQRGPRVEPTGVSCRHARKQSPRRRRKSGQAKARLGYASANARWVDPPRRSRPCRPRSLPCKRRWPIRPLPPRSQELPVQDHPHRHRAI